MKTDTGTEGGRKQGGRKGWRDEGRAGRIKRGEGRKEQREREDFGV